MAAGLLMALGLFGWDFDPELVGYFGASVVVMTFWAGTVAAIPLLIVVILAEAFAWRSMVFYLLVGGALGFFGEQIASQHGLLDFSEERLAILLAGGFAGGFVYWLLAGRLAGRGLSGPPRS